jgi:hypothetical protein
VGVREALGDLAVSLAQLSARPARPYVRSAQARFKEAFAEDEPVLFQAMECLALVEIAGPPAPADVAPVAAALAADPDVLGGVGAAFEYIGSDDGWFYGGAPWASLCLYRSAHVFLCELVPGAIDLEWTEAMDHWAYELYTPVTPPSGMPARHGWWFRAAT